MVRRRERLLSALVGGGVLAVIALALVYLGVSISQPEDGLRSLLLDISACAGLGSFVALHLGWTKLDTALSNEESRRVVFLISSQAVGEGAALLIIGATLVAGDGRVFPISDMTLANVGADLIAPLLAAVGTGAAIWLLGVALFGLPALALTAPLVGFWRWSVRRLLRSRTTDPGRRAAGC